MQKTTKTVRTYSRAKRKRTTGNEDAPKRIRVDFASENSIEALNDNTASKDLSALSSSIQTPYEPFSSDAAPFSDQRLPTSTPPSSPPPFLQDESFTSGGEGHDDNPEASRAPFARISGNGSKKLTSSSDLSQKPTKQKLVQMQLNLGFTTQKTCKTCGMAYVPSNGEDSALHTKFHEQNVAGIEVGKGIRKTEESNTVWRRSNGDLIVVVTPKARWQMRRKARAVLDIVQTELGAVDIPDGDLWGVSKPASKETEKFPVARERPPIKDVEAARSRKKLDVKQCYSRYQVYLYISGIRCVGLCLAETIEKAYRVVPSIDGDDHGHMALRNEALPATVGISRIWTSNSSRHKGIASTLLDSVSRNFEPRGPVDKEAVAFSQPTNSGTKLARRWFGCDHGWLVYRD